MMKYLWKIAMGWALCLAWYQLSTHVVLAEGLSLSPKTRITDVKKQLRPRRIALLIGVSRYQHKSWNDLRYPAKDVGKVHRFLQKEGQFDEIVSLLQPGQTSRRGILQGLAWLKRRNRSVHDTILIYVSGHGTIAQRKAGQTPERYLVTTDSSRDVPKTGIALATLRRLLQQLPSQRKVVILATCYVGTTKQPKKAAVKGVASGIKGVYRLGWVSRATLVLSAAGYMQPAYELSSLKGDVYTHFLLNCAKSLLQKNNRVTAAQAHHCATPKTYQFIRRKIGRRQTPLIESKITGRDTLYIAGQPVTRAALPPIQMGWIKLKRSQYRKVSILPIGRKGPTRPGTYPIRPQRWDMRMGQAEGFLLLRLLPGRYKLQLDSPTKGRVFREIHIRPGQTQLLSPSLVAPKQDTSPSYVNYFEFPEMGLYLELGPDLHVFDSDRLQIAGRFGFYSRYVSTAFVLALGPDIPSAGQEGAPLFRMGINGQFGLPLRFSRGSLFFSLYTEIGLWLTHESFDDSEPVFLFAYGPHIRFRWWVSDTVAIRMTAAFLFTVSQDQRVNRNTLEWRHRPQLMFGLGVDFGFPDWQ